MKKGTAFVFSGLLMACLLPMSFVLSGETTHPGTTAIPKTAMHSSADIGATIQPVQTAKTEDEIVAEILARKGKIYRIDVTGAGEDFDINPRTLIIRDGVEFFPQGVIHVIFGGSKLVSKETPILFRIRESVIEWVDTGAKSGEKGYELKFDSQDGDLFKGLTLTTSGFSMTAKSAKVKEEGDKVTISVID